MCSGYKEPLIYGSICHIANKHNQQTEVHFSKLVRKFDKNLCKDLIK